MSPKRHPSPYYHELDRVLLSFSKRDTFTIRDSQEGVLPLGGTGSGKTSGSGSALRTAYLKAGYGGLVLCAKPDEAESWIIAAHKAGRSDDVIQINASANQRFNLLDYANATIACDGMDHNLVVLMDHLAEATSVASTKSSSGENSFFQDAAMKWLSHTFPFLRVTMGTIRLKQVYDMVVSAPKNMKEIDSEQWRGKSLCWKVLRKAALMSEAGDEAATRVIDEHGDYWLAEIPNLADKTRSSIEASLTNLIYPFLSGKLAELFCTHTTVVPEMTREGKIIILDLPALTYGPMGSAAQSIFKYVFGLAMQREKISKITRPVFIWIDECQYFLSRSDAELLSTARSARIACVFITQDLPSFYAQLGRDARDVADSIISKFGTRIFHANTCRQTNLFAADTIGKMVKHNTSKTTSTGRNTGGSLNQNEYSGSAGAGDGRNQSRSDAITTYQDYVIPPEYFAKQLRTGGPKNKKKVDAIIVRNGKNYRETGAHWLKAEFSQ
jgi:type IV secretory pathway TraG/TraD family ATPase VirD4